MAAQDRVKETTAAEMSASAAANDAWSKLPGDLLGVVYGRIPSPPDRVRFTAVCRSWRDVLSWRPPPPALPWLILWPSEDAAAEHVPCFCPVDGAMFRVPLPAKAIGKKLVGSHDGGWIAAASAGDAETSLVIVNLFSGVELPLSGKQRRILPQRAGRPIPDIHKLIFSQDPASKRCILAATFTTSNTMAVGLCRVGCRNRGWSLSRIITCFSDIAFCHGKLYGLNHHRDVYMFDIGMTKNGASVITSGATYPLRIQQPQGMYGYGYHWIKYMFKHNDKLLMVQRMTKWSQPQEHLPFFKVYEFNKIDNDKATRYYEYTWEEVMPLDDHAMFLSALYSKLVLVPTCMRGNMETNHIYYNHPSVRYYEEFIGDALHLKIFDNGEHMYYMQDHKVNDVDRITSFNYMVNGCHTLMWILPPNF